MKIISPLDELLKRLTLVVGFVPQRPSLPILSNFLLEAEKGKIKTSATDLDATIMYEIPVKVEKEGKTTIPARLLLGFCQNTNSDKIIIENIGSKVVVSVGNAQAKLQTISADEFPPTADFDVAERIFLPKADVIKTTTEVCGSAAPEGGRPILTGVLLKPTNRGLEVVATDGYRLARKKLLVEGSVTAVIPSRTFQEAARALADESDDLVEIATNKEKNQVRIKTSRLKITTRLLEGDYPDYDRIIPSLYPTEATVSTKDLINALKQTATLSKDSSNVVGLDVRKNELIINASTNEVGEVHVRLEASIKGENLNTAFNSRFLLDSLSSVKAEKTLIRFSGSTSAALLQAPGSEDLIHLIMPVRTQS